jgi:hypothetical protein
MTEKQTIENASLGDIQAGDEVLWAWVREVNGLILKSSREGVAHHRDSAGDWCTKGSGRITEGKGVGVTITIHRTVRNLPVTPATLIIPNDGQEFITATVDGVVYRAREAVLVGVGTWAGAWRSGLGARSDVRSIEVTANAWKMARNAV